jgi:hypothetical protein
LLRTLSKPLQEITDMLLSLISLVELLTSRRPFRRFKVMEIAKRWRWSISQPISVGLYFRMQVSTGQMTASVMTICGLPEILQIPWIFTGVFSSTADNRLWILKPGTPSSVRNLNIALLHISYFIIFRSERNNQTLKLTPPPPYVRFVQRTISIQKRVLVSVVRPSYSICESWKNTILRSQQKPKFQYCV